ncbi:MAG: 1-(5-phosphoribosyl)-5-((5-phosphoribosylamino)methylideneamino)imidazole-4-carboxamide isomerase, partial [Armatimonadetes bacterium]|nr:1-(5-phosphoribosyl)-5-((5-phosphoribosylamino)methylideneamino)imidazole-4-carboxamide isomerase [Armatimonadota bacterium]
MQVIPAIDLRGGRCVRLMQGDYARQTTFGGDPLEYALRWQAEGAKRLHMVDLDAARSGAPTREHWDIVAEIARSLDIPVQLGGGIRTLDIARAALAMGVDRVIVGTAITGDEPLASRMFGELGEGVVAGIDAKDGLVAVNGWTGSSGRGAPEFARRMVELGARRIVFTDIARDGTEEGPNLASLRAVAEGLAAHVVASGGVGDRADVARLVRSAPSNVEAVIVGRALF